MPQEQLYLNNALIPVDQARISVYDVGFLQGVGLFETIRCYAARPFRLADHIDRLLNSAEKLGLQIARDHKRIQNAVAEVIAANELQDALIRITCTSGSSRKADQQNESSGTLLVTAEPMAAETSDHYEWAVLAVISPYKVNPADPLAGHQTTSNFARLAALQAAQQHKASEAICFTVSNRLAGGCMSSVFLVKDGKLTTPSLDSAADDSVTRQLVFDIAKKLNIECRQQELIIKDLLAADEIILANSIMELIPVGHVEKHIVSDGEPGPVYKQLHRQYRKMTRGE